MAVVQISRIQQRRGKKNSATGFPQLASGEIGWAIDTQELYIGNGSVSEGAPYVGNTQILTEHINILEFAEAYQYQRNNPVIQTGPTFLSPIERTLQDRFDERVDIRSFIPSDKIGPVGSIISDFDLSDDIQRAIDQLFLNDSTKMTTSTRVVLYFGPGTYKITREIRIPPYTSIEGAGIDSTIIQYEGTTVTDSVFRMVDSNSTPGNYTEFASMKYLERPRFIKIDGLTLKSTITNPIILLDNVDSSVFSNMKFVGTFLNGTNPYGSNPSDLTKQTGVWIRSTSSVFRSENVIFSNCFFENTGWGIFSETDHENIGISNCKFYQLFDAISIGGTSALSISRNDYIQTSQISVTNNTITINSHGFVENQLVTYVNGGGFNIGGLINNRSYYVKIVNANTIKLRSPAGGEEVDLLTTGNNAQYLRSSISTAGAINTKVIDSYFDLIDRYGFWVKLGKGNSSSGNKYLDVGNNTNGYANALYPIIRYDAPNNQSTGDYFERNTRMKDQTTFGGIAFYPNVKTSGLVVDPTNFVRTLQTTPTVPAELLRFPLYNSGTYVIDYVINKNELGSAIRTGRIHITVDFLGLAYHIQDDYSYTGNSTVENIEFSASLHDFDTDTVKETLVLKVWNPTGNGGGTINYSYRMLTQ